MRYEIEKILRNKFIVMSFCMMIVCNCVMFYMQCTNDGEGYTLMQIQDKYSSWETVAEEAMSLDDKIKSAAIYGDYEFIDNYIDENHLYQAVYERILQVQQYNEYRSELVSQAKLMLKIIGNSDSFATKNLQFGIDEYTKLESVTPEVCFTGGYEQLTSWHLSDIFVLIFSVASGLILLTLEDMAGYFRLIKTTYNGKSILYIRKFGTMIILVTIGYLMLRGSEFVIVYKIFGLENLSAPIQSIYGYNNATVAISIGQYLIHFYLLKYLWAVTCSSLFFGICAFCKSNIFTVSFTTAIILLSVFFAKIDNLWSQSLSLSKISQVEQFFQEPKYLNMLGTPLSRIVFLCLFLSFLLITSFIVGLIAFSRSYPHELPTRAQNLPILNWGCHTNLWRHEGYKFWITHNGIAVLLIFLLIQCSSYMNFQPVDSEFEYYYSYYSSVLQGYPSVEKDTFIQAESARFLEINEQIQTLHEQYPDQTTFAMAAGDLPNKLRPQEAFEKAKQQYETLVDGQSYLYETPYEYLFGSDGQKEDILNLAKSILALFLVISCINAVEKETGVSVIQIAAGIEREIMFCKKLHVLLFAILTGLVAFLPMRISIVLNYGTLNFSAQANSIRLFSSLDYCWSVGVVFSIQLAWMLAWNLCACILTFIISRKTGNQTITLLLCIPILIIPLILAFL